jgi:hypothetical protein
LIDVRPIEMRPHTLVAVTIPYDDEETRRQAIEHGAKWKRHDKTWLMPYENARKMGLFPPDRNAYPQPLQKRKRGQP